MFPRKTLLANIWKITAVKSYITLGRQGWFIFGGMSSKLSQAQKLSSIDDEWELGPDLYEKKNDYYHCIVQVSLTPPLFFCLFINLPLCNVEAKPIIHTVMHAKLLSVTFSVFPSSSVFLSVSALCLSPSLCFSLSVSVSVFLCQTLSLSLSVSQILSQSLYLNHSLTL